MFRRFLMVLGIALMAPLLVGDDAEESREAVAERLKPFGKSCLEGQDCGSAAPTPTEFGVGLSGKGVYDKYCSACHETGLNEAPLVASDAWDERIAKGEAVVFANTKKGFNEFMPPKGNCLDCTDDELRAAIDYMVTGDEEGTAFP